MRLSDVDCECDPHGMIIPMEGHDYDRFRVDDRAEVLALLRQSVAVRALCSVRAAGRPESYLSPLRALGEDGEPVFDAPRAPVIERALTPGSVAAIDLRLQDMRVSFEARVKRIGVSEGKPVLQLGQPERVLRLQRRETFRVRIPTGYRVLLTLDSDVPSLTELPMHDLCLQGGSLTANGMRERFEAGAQFDRARLTLPTGAEWPLTLRIAHASVLRRFGDTLEMRIGVQFMQLPAGFETAVGQLLGGIARDPGLLRRA
jgi:c-di-GMP-binding flagellar brake protein YcgR